MIYEDILPKYLAIGVSYERFMDSCPKELKPFVEAEKIRIKKRDEDMWVMGIYVQSAVGVAVEHCLVGRKAHLKYLKHPLREAEAEEQELTEEKIQKQRELFMTKLMLMKTNYDLNKNDSVS